MKTSIATQNVPHATLSKNRHLTRESRARTVETEFADWLDADGWLETEEQRRALYELAQSPVRRTAASA